MIAASTSVSSLFLWMLWCLGLSLHYLFLSWCVISCYCPQLHTLLNHIGAMLLSVDYSRTLVNARFFQLCTHAVSLSPRGFVSFLFFHYVQPSLGSAVSCVASYYRETLILLTWAVLFFLSKLCSVQWCTSADVSRHLKKKAHGKVNFLFPKLLSVHQCTSHITLDR